MKKVINSISYIRNYAVISLYIYSVICLVYKIDLHILICKVSQKLCISIGHLIFFLFFNLTTILLFY